ncbi:MAG: glycosyltransferase family 9 protein [Acidobacteria bacterium]|nr:glycosyltransferase family 9 protein [Acidobacteriota bacterium]
MRLPVSAAGIDWKSVRKVLVVRLRSIGDTVLATPSLTALRRFLPEAQIDVLLEDWVAPVLDGFDAVDNVLTVSRRSKKSRFEAARRIRRARYDVAFNLHGGTTATFFVRVSGAPARVGFATYSYSFLYTHLLSSSADYWAAPFTHSAEQQLALLGFVGVPVEDRPKTRLAVTEKARIAIDERLKSAIRNPQSAIALLHPVAAFDTKQWATENFARTAEFLAAQGFQTVAVATTKERAVLDELKRLAGVPVATFDDLSLPEITALAARAGLFVGNDSGIAHIAAAVETPSVVVFGSSNRHHWRPWTNAPHELVYEEFPCQPCAGYVCKEFDAPRCILSVKTDSVVRAIEKLLAKK